MNSLLFALSVSISCNFTSQPLRANTVIARVRVKTVDHKLSMRKHVFVIPNNLVLTYTIFIHIQERHDHPSTAQ
ncbi:hypothetical protein BC936DRAFT_144034 [Jimgerdemannia flammicorona]|uniref:Uncharacterized protein n=1 Tax=Jimgerdemannia flammicorona TaxID=994334 RepID=A0A432ZY50_9FUNG|nr:hypothetical protein BC936DRAFT_144034 [Jimgerdemannia flammicorona]